MSLFAARGGGNLLLSKNRTTDAETTKEATQHNGHRKQTDREKLMYSIRTGPLTLLDLFSQKSKAEKENRTFLG